jgi:hypothetical protein
VTALKLSGCVLPVCLAASLRASRLSIAALCHYLCLLIRPAAATLANTLSLTVVHSLTIAILRH